MAVNEEWNPEQAGAELKALFDKANEIFSKPIYQEASADSLDGSRAGSNQTTAANESQGLTQL